MNALLHRAIVFVSGQGDELATPYAGCSGGCLQGRCACDCLARITCTELDLELPHDASRTFAPRPKPEPIVHTRTVAIAAAAFIALGVLLLCFPRHAQSAALVVLVGQK